MRGKAPTRKQKECLNRNGLDPSAYVVLRDMLYTIVIQHRETGEIQVAEK